MTQQIFSRTELLIGPTGLNTLKNSTVVIFGIGGVGSFTTESLVRAGVGNLILIDDDTICLTNVNRQIIADHSTIGKLKVEVMKDRIQKINPNCSVTIHKLFVKEGNIENIIPKNASYVVDAIDTVSSKLSLIVWCKKNNIPIISSMGTGNKLDPTMFKITDIFDTKVCPLAKVIRHELRKRNIQNLKVLYSEETPLKPKIKDINTCTEECICTNVRTFKPQVPGSISFVPPVAGMIIAGEVIKNLLKI
ncbi:tRNA threonylcarbamoyladenosine dehydratase [Clostridium rectalis]|uniref:tRNA threonylcarbamoyladenosine dehydratase n=1 Tax=Clostridium rectalis TaxID=2040295 RepID=UPI000F63C5AD|nr:tRNA threonylcarbamoyladenosine dehydratase [Clostridium rectalis]